MIELINERALILGVADRWRKSYPKNVADRWGADKPLIAEALDRLDKETATAADVKAIIGNSSWTDVPRCDNCGEQKSAVVQVGQEPDYESATANICLECAIDALSAFRVSAPHPKEK